jgi:hypothetical protein
VILVASWTDGVSVIGPDDHGHELPGRSVACLASDGGSGALAIVDGTTLARRGPDGRWTTMATSELDMECCLAVNGGVYAGTRGAHLLRVAPDAAIQRLAGFDATEGRDRWYAGSAVVDGEVVGPPLSVRSLTGTPDGRLLLAGVHVGGIARSDDGGTHWHPTIPIDWDVHDVRVHPEDPDLAIAAAAAGLCVSTDGGATWALEVPSSTERYGSAVAFAGDALLVSVSSDHFAPHGTVYGRAIDSPGTLAPVGGGLPDRLDGIVDTRCIASNGSRVAVVDRGGNVFASADGGDRWERVGEGVPHPSGVLIL